MTTSLFLLLAAVLIGSILVVVTMCTVLDESPQHPAPTRRRSPDEDLLPGRR